MIEPLPPGSALLLGGALPLSAALPLGSALLFGSGLLVAVGSRDHLAYEVHQKRVGTAAVIGHLVARALAGLCCCNV